MRIGFAHGKATMPLSREQVALALFCVMRMKQSSWYDSMSEQEIRTCFQLADVFLAVAAEEHK